MKDSEYLKLMVKDKNLQLQHLHQEHLIAIAVYNTKRDYLLDEIASLEKQLRKK